MYSNDMYFDDDSSLTSAPQFTLDDALKALPLSENATIVPPEVIFGLSDLSYDQVKTVKPVWESLPGEQRVMIMERLAEASEADFAVDYAVFASIGYQDRHQAVRRAAIQAGWTDTSLPTMQTLIDLAQNDPTAEVRAAAIRQLGDFIYLGEVEDLDKEDTVAAEEVALALLRNPKEALEVHRSALEAISHCTREGVRELIQEGYHHDDFGMRVSAVKAMGHSCDPFWSATVMSELENEQPEMLLEAIRAAGTLGLRDAIETLSRFGYDEDPEIQESAIYALGEIGGDEALDALQMLDAYASENDLEDLAEVIEEAMSVAVIMSDLDADFDLMAFDDDDDYDDED